MYICRSLMRCDNTFHSYGWRRHLTYSWNTLVILEHHVLFISGGSRSRDLIELHVFKILQLNSLRPGFQIESASIKWSKPSGREAKSCQVGQAKMWHPTGTRIPHSLSSVVDTCSKKKRGGGVQRDICLMIETNATTSTTLGCRNPLLRSRRSHWSKRENLNEWKDDSTSLPLW